MFMTAHYEFAKLTAFAVWAVLNIFFLIASVAL